MAQQDLVNADVIVIEGSNMAECHPVGFQWVMEAKARGAKIIHIDPRYTRTSAMADTYVPIRAGTDIAFLGGVINYVLSNGLEFREYVEAYTNASSIVSDHFVDTDELDGLFSGFDPATGEYDTSSWQFAGEEAHGTNTGDGHQPEAGDGATVTGERKDPTLQDPRCVFQLLKKHYARYTPEMVEEVCGIPQALFAEVAADWAGASGRERTAALVYSVGWTHHTVGVQYIRSGALLQLLLGNMGRPGGGILALRGHASIQGSTDIPTLFSLLPGYLPMPDAATHETFADYLGAVQKQKGTWGEADAYTISLLKAWFGDAATAENDWGYGFLPKIDGDHGTYQQVMDMVDGKMQGYFLVGQNPAVGSAHGKLQRLGMANLDWLVVRDFNLIESATWWKDSPEIETGEIVPEQCRTEVFFLPAAAHTEKEGSWTQTQRLLQWRDKAVEPQGDQRSELWFYYHLGRMLKEAVADSTDPRDAPLQAVTWDYLPAGEDEEPSAELVLKEINGYHLGTGDLVASSAELKADGSTSAGCWIYTGVYAGDVNHAADRVPHWEQDETAAEWGWAWPANRRTLYNRASADPQGKPWSERKKLIWWDADAGRWVGNDVPDFVVDKAPDYVPAEGATGTAAVRGDEAFVMQSDGRGALYAPTGLVDGPMPTHYEPHESPFRNALYGQQASPTRQVSERPDTPSNPSAPDGGSRIFPYVFTTSRLTEHHTSGAMSRFTPYLNELQPEMFVEVSPELARERNLEHLGWCHLITSRSAIEAKVLVTDRMMPLYVGGRVMHQISVPYHWGTAAAAQVQGDSANDLIGIVLDRNVHIQESKVGSCDIQPGRRPRGPALLDYVQTYRDRAGITTRTGAAP